MTELEEIKVKKVIHKYSMPIEMKTEPTELVGKTLEEIMHDAIVNSELRAFTEEGLDMMAEELHKLYSQRS